MNSHATTSTSTISFAPLPDLAPRKRKSTVQLGVAARSNMLRNRRMFMAAQEEALRMAEEQEGIQVISADPNGIKSPSDSAVMYVHGGTRGPRMVGPQGWSDTYEPNPIHYLPRDPGLAEDAVEDAFIALGKMVKGAGKSLWKKMSVSRRGSLDDVSKGERERKDKEAEKRSSPTSEKEEKERKKKQGSVSKRLSRGFNGDVATVLASEGGANALSLQAILEEEKSRRHTSSPAHDPASEAEEEVADIVLTHPNAPHPSEHIELPDTLPADFLNITQPSDEPCPPTALPDLADDTDSESSHSTAGQFEVPATPPTEPVQDSAPAEPSTQ
ncbi:hypothetical protein EIP91_001997 [Steccherinum ochraceum]|uniref:Uncharacterized protein n=1 Tax=Steccherinum ochraceum TaxID=92696 RepID=A0A4R0RLD9_9APHY|nr:hypothetical protein EIP91_001997 [Steccherinum ochraceum]